MSETTTTTRKPTATAPANTTSTATSTAATTATTTATTASTAAATATATATTTTTSSTAGRERAGFAEAADVDAFLAELRRFERGEIDAEQWRAYRTLRGVYGQRQEGHMVRVKVPQGVLSAEQLRAIAAVARPYARGFGHITTRQDVQLHFVAQEHLVAVLARLGEAGLTTHGACGNAVRNVVACPHAGVSQDELFDVTPYAEAVTRHFLRHPLGSSLPRKFKIAFEGCAEDHARTAIQDIGFRARLRSEGARAVRGFAVTVAGGTSSACTSGSPLVEFLPAADVLALAEAIVRVFHARGDREHRQRNRLKFLVRQLGFETFRTLLTEELARVRAEGAPALPFDPEAAPVELPPARARPAAPSPPALAARVAADPPRGPGLLPDTAAELAPPAAARELFRRTNAQPQRQRGYSTVTLSPARGDLTAAQLEAVADLALAYGDGAVRLASGGHVLLRWVPDAEIEALYEGAAAAGLGRAGAGSAGDVIACPGAESCRLAVADTRLLARDVDAHVRGGLGARALTERLPLHVSGCPNGCSQHHLAAIGLQGSLRKLAGRAVPQYFVLLGGGVDERGARFGKLAAKIPRRRVPEAVERLTALWLAARRPGEEAGAFFAREHERARAALRELEELRVEDVREEDFAPLEDGGPAEPSGPATTAA
ncbi:nitrite/sulfite reductase [Anaeromyxobacter diazotrophicus]|uniref:nitrite/sulfite reductase n=1 Tax=Anaeromyxobacter diazotrophicus TaxID=2590199 RepID=UPI001F2821D6|nr:nitrite/sulfite reductase [Anaeromyxobacter diazotrophicus]